MIHSFSHLPPYSVSGQSGKALSAARIPLSALGAADPVLEARSMEADALRWYQRGGPVPEYGQEITLWDAAGKRLFQGNVTAVDPDWDGSGVAGYPVTVSGPWWWLEQAQLTGLVTDSSGAEAERPLFVFPAGDLAGAVRSLIDRMRDLGVPLRIGPIDPTFHIPQMTMQATTAADALRDMLAWTPDAMTRVRYDVDGLPMLEVYRRPTAPVRTLETGTDADLTGIPRLRARRQLRPTEVRVQNMEVDAAGAIVFSEQIAGDTSGVLGVLGRQLLAVSGPGRPEYRAFAPRVGSLQTETVAAVNALLALDPAIQGFVDDFGALGLTSGYSDVGYQPALSRAITGLGTHRIIAGEVSEWMRTEFGLVTERTRIQGYYFANLPSPYGTSIANLISAGLAIVGFLSGFNRLALRFDFEVETVSAEFLTEEIFVHPADRALVTPVPGLAENLYLAQDWTPYDGTVPLHPGAAVPLPGAVLNLRGAVPEWATMRALVTGAEIDLQTGASQITLGAPQRSAASALVDRFLRPASGRVIDL